MIPSPSSPTPSFSFVDGAGQPSTAPELPEATSGDSVAAKPSFNDDDDFYILYLCEYSGRTAGGIKQEGIDLLIKNNPGIFDGVEKNTLNSIRDDGNSIWALFNSDPVKYQPIARYIHQGHTGSLCACAMTYGEYKGNFYTIEEDDEGAQWVNVHSDHYKLMLENKRFVSQMRELLFDQSISDNDKVVSLQMLFPPIDQSDKDVSIKQLRENMDYLFGNTFKQAQQRAINSGFKP